MFAGVGFDVAEGGPVVGFVEDAGVEAALEEVAGAVVLGVEVHGPPGVDAEEEASEGFGGEGDEEKMYVVVKDAIAVDFDAFLFGDYGESFEVLGLVETGSEEGASVDAAGGGVDGDAGDDEAEFAGHLWR